MTVVFNRIDIVLESVKFSEISWNETSVGVFLFSTSKRVFLLRRSFHLFLCDFLIAFLSDNSNVHVIWISDKETFNCIKFVSILIVQRGERLKFKVY